MISTQDPPLESLCPGPCRRAQRITSEHPFTAATGWRFARTLAGYRASIYARPYRTWCAEPTHCSVVAPENAAAAGRLYGRCAGAAAPVRRVAMAGTGCP